MCLNFGERDMMKQTPLGLAILRLFGDLGERLAERHLPRDAVRAYLFGGCAVHIYAAARTTSEVNVDVGVGFTRA